MFYADKQDARVLFCDNRREDITQCDGRHTIIDPDILCDFTGLPFRDNEFNVVVFDPPHLNRVGKTSWLAQKFGRLVDGWDIMIERGFSECFRVLKPSGLLIFKWSEIQIPLSKILSLTPVSPLIQARSGKRDTHWCIFYKEAE